MLGHYSTLPNTLHQQCRYWGQRRRSSGTYIVISTILTDTHRALKTKHDTPKYGLIYHASLVGQSAPKNKGKISRMLAAKASLCVRVDALGEEEEPTIGLQSRALVEQRLRECEQTKVRS